MSSGSPSTTSGPPPASSWGTPPEFYLDENSVTRAVRKCLIGLGYAVHTPGELYGSWDAARGAEDEDWLPKVGKHGWVVIGTDLKIFERPEELAAYRSAKVHVFLLPGQSKVVMRVALIEACLADICTKAAGRKPDVWRLTMAGVELYEVLEKPKRVRKPA